MTGCDRYLNAAKAGVEYQRNSFKMITSDGKHCFWAYGRRRQKYGTIPLYEQIYAIASLAQYYRITADPKALMDIRQSVNTFEKYYRDNDKGGYFSHLDYASQTPTVTGLGDNQSRKNWNSIGDHIPAYLINILLSLKSLPSNLAPELKEFVQICETIFDDCIENILQHFTDPDGDNPYVRERFYQNWEPDEEINQTTLNVKPDYLPNDLKIISIVIDGITQTVYDATNLQIAISAGCKQVKVEYEVQELSPKQEETKGKI